METKSSEIPTGYTEEVDHDDSIPVPIIEQLEAQERAARRRMILVILAIVLIGAAIIGAVLGVTLTRKSNASTTLPPSTYSPSDAPTIAVADASPALLSPGVSPSLAIPTIKPVSVRPTVLPTTKSPFILNFTTPTQFPTTNRPITSSPTSFIFGVLQAVALNGGEEFKNQTSYQSKAYSFLRLNGRVDEEWQIVQRYALACIYFSTYGVAHQYTNPGDDKWTNSDGWLTQDEECTWFGITCDGNQRVEAITLPRNNLTGTFPREVILLNETLKELDIGDNKIYNKDADVFFLINLRNLVRLDIGNTFFTFNGLPPVFGKLTNLVYLDISYTLMFGPMRADQTFRNLRQLRQLQMGGLDFDSSIPTEIANLPNLTRFYCDNSAITGTLDFIAEMPSIFEIWMDRNPRLNGKIPNSIGNKSTILQSMSFSKCSLTGTIPESIGDLVDLQQLRLDDNLLTGTIPTSLASLVQLYSLDLSGNNLVGNLPEEFCESRDVPFDDLCFDCEEVTCCCCSCCKSDSCTRL